MGATQDSKASKVAVLAYTDLSKTSRIRWTWHVPDGVNRYDGTLTPTMEVLP